MILNYVERLKKMNFKAHNAARLCQDILLYLDEKHLAAMVDSLEAEGYVAGIQSKPDRT